MDVEAVLDLDFSDPGVLSKAIGTMSSSFDTNSNHCLIITDENTDSIVDIESLDELSELVQDYVTTEQDSVIVEEIVESGDLGEDGVEFFTIDGFEGGGEEIVTQALSPSQFSQPELIDTTQSANVALPLLPSDTSQTVSNGSTSVAEAVTVDVFTNGAKEASSDGRSFSVAKVHVPVTKNDISQTENVEKTSDNRAQLVLEDGIIADDMNSLFEQFESQDGKKQSNPVTTTKSSKTQLSIIYKGLDNIVCTTKSSRIERDAPKSSLTSSSKQFTLSASPQTSTYIASSKVAVPITMSNVHLSSDSVLVQTAKQRPQMVSLLNTKSAKFAASFDKRNMNSCLQERVGFLGQNFSNAPSDTHALLLQPTDVLSYTENQLVQVIPETTQVNTEDQLADISVSVPFTTAPDVVTVPTVAVGEGLDWMNFPSQDTVACELEVVSDPTFDETVSLEHLPEVQCETEIAEETVGPGVPCASDPLGLLGDVMAGEDKYSSIHLCQNKTSGGEYSHSPGLDTLSKIPGYMSTLTQGGTSLPLDDTSQIAASSLLNNSASSALINRDASPERGTSHDMSVYNRIPEYCSNFTASQQYNNAADSPSRSRSNRKKRTKHRHKHHHSHKHSRHYRRSRKRMKARRDSSSSFYDCSSDDDVIGISRPKYRSSSSSLSSSSYSSSSELSSTDSSSGSECRRSRSRSPHRCKHASSRSHKPSKSRSRKRRRCHYKKGRSRVTVRSRCSRSRSRSVSCRRSRSQSSDASWRRRRHQRSQRTSADSSDSRRPEKDAKKEAHELAMAQRRVVYVGGISDSHTPSDLNKRFGVFGHIETSSVHFRLRGDNYGFVTYESPKDAQTAITNGNKVGGPYYNLCFGGRRMFCKTDYADLDGCTAVKEEWALHERTREEPSDDFDVLLQQTLKKLK